jgi:adenine-specific DNA-methyltransferase
VSIGSTQATIFAQERERVRLQAEIDAERSATERNRRGQFATPNDLANEIAQFVRTVARDDIPAVHFGDPAIGTGSFFSAALAVFGPSQIKSAVGVELDPVVADAAQKLWSGFGLHVIHGDFTRLVATGLPTPAPNLILANPPYVRHHHMNRSEKERLQRLTYKMTGVDVSGLAGLYVHFLCLATAWLEDGGYAAWLVPSEFMDVNYGAALRQYLTQDVTLLRIHRFKPEDTQFADALVSSAVVVFRKHPPPFAHKCEFTFGGSLQAPQAGERLTLDQLRHSYKWTIYPAHPKNDRQVQRDADGMSLADLFRIQRGIATGANSFFILPRSDAKRRRIPPSFLRPILPSPRCLNSTVIESDDEGFPLIDPQLCLLDCALPEYVVKQRYPTLWAYLQTAEALGVRARYLVRKRSPWYKQEHRDPSLFLCTYMGRGQHDKCPFRFIYNRSQAIATNLYLMLYPRNRLRTMLRDHPARVAEVHELLSQVTGDELRGEGRVYGGGLNKIEPSELGRVSARQFLEKWPELAMHTTQETTASLFG